MEARDRVGKFFPRRRIASIMRNRRNESGSVETSRKQTLKGSWQPLIKSRLIKRPAPLPALPLLAPTRQPPSVPRCRPFVANLTLIKVLATPKSVPPDRSRLVHASPRGEVARRLAGRSCKSIFITFRRIHYQASVETRGNGLIDATGLR